MADLRAFKRLASDSCWVRPPFEPPERLPRNLSLLSVPPVQILRFNLCAFA